MLRLSNLKIPTDKLWFGLLVTYILSGYLAQGVLLPEVFNSLFLYAFLAYSVFAILYSGKIKLSPILSWGAICLILAFIAMLYSQSFSILGGTYYELIVNFVIVLILTQMPWTEKRFDLIMGTYVIASALLIIALALTGNLEDTSETGRLGEDLMGNANILAMMLMISAIYAIWLIISSDNKKTKILSFVAVLIIYYGLFLSGGRKFIVVPIIFAYILSLYKTDKNGRKNIIKSTLIIAAIIIAVYLLIMKVPYFYDMIGYRFDGFFALFDDSADVDGSTQIRMKMIEAAWAKWKESPLWGYGFDSFKYYNKEYVTGHQYYSHNNFTELLYNQGLIGFLGYYSFYAFLIYKALKTKTTSIYKGFALAIVVSLLAFEYFGVTYSITPAQILLFFGCYCIEYVSKIEPKSN